MRWWIGIFVLLLAGASAISFWRGRPPTLGADLLRSLEAKKGPMRGAIQLLDYAPDPAALQAQNAEKVQRGDGGLPGQGLSPVYGQHWLRGPDLEFVWQTTAGKPRADLPLPALTAETAPARQAVARAIADAGYYPDAINAALARAIHELAAMTDEQLFLAWLRADRAVLAESVDLARAAREGLLLLSRQNTGPAILFTSAKARVYLLPLDGPPSANTSVICTQLEAYEEGRLIWTGVLRMEGSPDPQRVRQVAARVAQEPSKPPLPK